MNNPFINVGIGSGFLSSSSTTGSNNIGVSASPIAALTTAQIQALTSVPMPGTMGSARIVFLNNGMRAKIGFIGLGFVGGAIADAYSDFETEVIKLDPAKGFNSSYKDLTNTEGIFVSVPSPQTSDGSADTRILESVLENLRAVDYHGVIISKTTAPPEVYNRLQKQYKNLVHVPEFLTAANAKLDYMRSKFAYIGGEVTAYRNEAERLIKIGLPDLKNFIHCSIAEASLAKYTLNTFLATKVVFMNEIAKLAESLGCNYETVARMVMEDDRIGNSHMRVPGPDGAYGFGGMCFPKDTQAMLKFAEEAGTSMMVLEAAVKKNTFLRLTEPK